MISLIDAFISRSYCLGRRLRGYGPLLAHTECGTMPIQQ
jgi:hypothetical protein